MAKARTPGSGGEYLVDATQIPTAISFPAVPSRVNRLDNVDEWEVNITAASTGEVARFVAKANGRIVGALVKNGSVAADGTNGWRVTAANESRSDAEVMDFGIGTGTNAGAADDGGALAASTLSRVANSKTATTARFSEGDIVTVDVTEDGTAGVASVVFLVSYESEGYSA